MMSVRTVEDVYQFSLKAEKLARKQIQRGRGKIPTPNKRKGVTHDKAHKSNDEIEKPHNHSERGGNSRGIKGGGRSSSRGSGRRGGGELRFYAYGKTWHMSWECIKKNKEGGGEYHISEAQRRDVEEEGAEDGRSLMLRKVLLKPEAEFEKPV
jgi:hypothetical protein